MQVGIACNSVKTYAFSFYYLINLFALVMIGKFVTAAALAVLYITSIQFLNHQYRIGLRI